MDGNLDFLRKWVGGREPACLGGTLRPGCSLCVLETLFLSRLGWLASMPQLLCPFLFPQGWKFKHAVSHSAFKGRFWGSNSHLYVCAASTVPTELSPQPGNVCFKDYLGFSYVSETDNAKTKRCKVIWASIVDTSKNCICEIFSWIPSCPSIDPEKQVSGALNM